MIHLDIKKLGRINGVAFLVKASAFPLVWRS